MASDTRSMSAGKGGGRMIRNKSSRSINSYDQAYEIQHSGMRLVCKNGPGCKNHDWRKAGAATHTRKSYHNAAISQPVGGGF
jgi:hypothetical protein